MYQNNFLALDCARSNLAEQVEKSGSTPIGKKQRQALDFIYQWLKGKKYFDIKTSGATGKPKKIRISSTHMEKSANKTVGYLHLKKHQKALLCLDPLLIAGKMMIVRALLARMQLIIMEPCGNPLENLPEYLSIDFAAMVPLQLQAGIKRLSEKPGQVKTILCGSAPISPALEISLQKIRTAVYESYGMTETVSHIALRRVNGAGKSQFFTLLEGIEAGLDTRGCLTVRGDVTGNSLLVTNDVVKLISARQFEWLGRADHVINSGGIKIYPEEVEKGLTLLLTKANIDISIMACGLDDSRLGSRLVIIVEGSPLDGKTEFIITTLFDNLPRYHAPREIRYLKSFKRTANGKLRRAETIALLD